MSRVSPTVYLVDDDEAVREGLSLLIHTVGLEVQSYAAPADFLAAFDPEAIGCLVLDVRMPGMSGLRLQELLKERGVDLPVILMTGHGDVNLARRAFLAGAVEFLPKPVDEQTLIETLQRAVRAHIGSRERAQATRQARERLERLSARELEVLRLMVEGQTSKQIAKRLAVSPRTVETHRAHLMEKLEADSLAALIRLYLVALEGRP